MVLQDTVLDLVNFHNLLLHKKIIFINQDKKNLIINFIFSSIKNYSQKLSLYNSS